MSTVFQDWFHKMPWKMQSIFVNGLRAPDDKSTDTKSLVRWMRTKTCHDADPQKADCYMTAPTVDMNLIVRAGKEMEYLTCHYVHHLADSMRVLSIYHPDEMARKTAWDTHFHIAEELFHFLPESVDAFVVRHLDKVEHE